MKLQPTVHFYATPTLNYHQFNSTAEDSFQLPQSFSCSLYILARHLPKTPVSSEKIKYKSRLCYEQQHVFLQWLPSQKRLVYPRSRKSPQDRGHDWGQLVTYTHNNTYLLNADDLRQPNMWQDFNVSTSS